MLTVCWVKSPWESAFYDTYLMVFSLTIDLLYMVKIESIIIIIKRKSMDFYVQIIEASLTISAQQWKTLPNSENTPQWLAKL